MIAELAAYAGLFSVAFIAATLLPAQSEAVLVGMQIAGFPPVLLVIVAAAGNTLGAATNWVVGRGIDRFHHKRWFPASPEQVEKASGWYRKWGRWSLLLSWAPVFGDALTVAAGVLREPFLSFFVIVAIAKTGRYIALAYITATQL